ncbi:MAG: hypothetical protein GY859_07060, partial [Desulfobacterales bacterium]|nr:hypothetical protein [Desulfobacterales bacterium]
MQIGKGSIRERLTLGARPALSLAFIALLLIIGSRHPAAATPADDTHGVEAPLKFTSGKHALWFGEREMVIASGDHAARVEFVGATGRPPAAEKATSSTGARGSRPLNKVTYPDLWKGVTLVYENQGGAVVKSAYYIEPAGEGRARGGSPYEQIRLRYNAPVRLAAGGGLTLDFETGQLRESAPEAWQEIAGRRVPVEAKFRLLGDREVGFHVGAHDPAALLVIDPTVTWNTFGGNSGGDEGHGVAVDGSNVYVSGWSAASWGSPLNSHAGGSDAFVAKFDENGGLLWHRFLGGGGNDYANGLAVFGGDVYVIGLSNSAWGAPVRGYTAQADAFVAKINAAGVLQWHTFLGGSSTDVGDGVFVDGGGDVYVAGSTAWNSWGSPVDAHVNDWDGFAARLNASGILQWNTFMGGAGYEEARAVAVYGGNVYIAGFGNSFWGGPIVGPSGNYDAFAVKLNGSGVRLWNTFMGGAGEDKIYGMAVDASGNAFIAGYSNADWGSPVEPYTSMSDAFIAKLDANGARQWHSFLGGAGNDIGQSVALNGSDIHSTGYSSVSWGSPQNAHSGGNDAFFARLDSGGNHKWSTFMGDSGDEHGWGVALNVDNYFIVGWGGAWGSPVAGHAGGNDAFVVKLSPTPPTVSTTTPSAITASGASGGGGVSDEGDDPVTARGVCWSESANPTTGDSCTTDGSGTGSFTSTLTGLDSNTTYHVRAYATSSAGTGYGADLSFTTDSPTVSFTSVSQSAAENAGSMTITAQLSVASGLAVQVPFTVSGSATGGGTDYSITASPVAIPAGATTQTITITVNDDALDENDETVVVTMGSPVNATQGATAVHTATITDNDDPPTVAFTSASQSEAENVGAMTITAQLSAPSGLAVDVPFTVSGAAAGGGTDYSITASPVAIPAGATTQTITITVNDDALDENDETVV